MEYLFVTSAPVALTRSARWVPNYANVPRFGLRPNLLLDFATSDTQRTPLVAVRANLAIGAPLVAFALAVAELGSDPNSGSSLQASQPCITDLGSDPISAACTNVPLFIRQRGFSAIAVR